jgi:hypothetical protein
MSRNFGNLNHGGCAPLAIEASIEFFDAFYLPSSVQDTERGVFTDFVHPNPVNDILNFNNEYPIDALLLYDAYGQMFEVDVRRQQIDVSHLAAGMYVAIAQSGNTMLQQKVILMH